MDPEGQPVADANVILPELRLGTRTGPEVPGAPATPARRWSH